MSTFSFMSPVTFWNGSTFGKDQDGLPFGGAEFEAESRVPAILALRNAPVALTNGITRLALAQPRYYNGSTFVIDGDGVPCTNQGDDGIELQKQTGKIKTRHEPVSVTSRINAGFNRGFN